MSLVSVSCVVAGSIAFFQDPVDLAQSKISDWSNDNQKADDFVLTGDQLTVTRIYWWGSYGADPDPSADQFVFKFFTEDPLQPGWPFQLGYGDGTGHRKTLVH
jgi:hypothetical protein